MNEIIMLEVVDTGVEVFVFTWHRVNVYNRKYTFGEFSIVGKKRTYLIEGVDTYEQAKAIAIWYDKRLTNGKLRRFGLD